MKNSYNEIVSMVEDCSTDLIEVCDACDNFDEVFAYFNQRLSYLIMESMRYFSSKS